MNKVVIFYGSRIAFERVIPQNNYRNLTEMVMELDVDSRSLVVELPDRPTKEKQKLKIENFIVGSDEYAGVREHVILNFANFLAKMDIENLFLQNPPLSISSQIQKLYPQTEILEQEYKVLSKKDIIKMYISYSHRIKGQDAAKMQLLRALYPLTSDNRTKPVVILFYGDTGLGKTETAQFVSDIIGEKLFRKQFSMFQNNQFATYLFGGAHYERSFAKELLDRESNVILLDEFDKANSTFHSAFYQLFDEGIYEDQNYHLKLLHSIIICTSNYKSIDDIKTQLGKAIFSRFDATIKFDNLSADAKSEIAQMQYTKKLSSYSQDEQLKIQAREIEKQLIGSCKQCNNAREISHLIDDIFSLILINDLIGQLEN